MGRHSSTSSCASALANGPGPPTLPSPGPPSYPGPYDGLPAKFVQSMKTLFDILDEKGSGLVPLRDIETRWAKQANAQVLDNLRNIAAQNQGQLLSFDRFCLALKMALLAESPKSSCNNSVSSVTSGGSAPSNSQSQAASKNTPLDNLQFNHRRQGSSSSGAGSLDSPRFAPMTSNTSSAFNGSGGSQSRLPKFGSGGAAQPTGGNPNQAQSKTTENGPAPTRAASVPPSVSDPFSHQGDTNLNGTAPPAPKLNASFENLLETPAQSKLPPRKPFSSSTTHQTQPQTQQQQQPQQQAGHQRPTILPPSSSMVRPPSGVKVLSRPSNVSGVTSSTPSYVGNRIPPPGRPGPPTQSNTRRIVRPPGAPLEPTKFQIICAPTATEGTGRSRTPDNFLENSGGQSQRAIKPPMMRSVSNIADAMPNSKSMNEPANRSPFSLGSMPGQNAMPPPPAKSSFTPVAPPAARRAYSVMHEIHSQAQHHHHNHHHAAHLHHQEQYLQQYAQNKWEPSPPSHNQGNAMMAPIQTEQVHTANKVSIGSALHRGGPVNKTQMGQVPRFIPQPSVSSFSQTAQAQINSNSSISQSSSSPLTNPVHTAPNPQTQNGFIRSANSRDLNAMVRAVPCQASTANVQQTQQVPMRQMAAQLQTPGGPKPEKPPRRREPRRHTLAHGIEYGTIRRLKLLEQEREVLQKGLQAVERAKDWYLRQISFLQEKLQAPASAHGAPEYSTDAHEERLRFQMARILDVNQHLAALVDSGDKPSFPLHMNLALLNVNVNQNSLQNQAQSQDAANEAKRLREHNVKLASDLEKKQELVAQLEAEKTQLVRELFASKAQQQQAQRYRGPAPSSVDTTLM